MDHYVGLLESSEDLLDETEILFQFASAMCSEAWEVQLSGVWPPHSPEHLKWLHPGGLLRCGKSTDAKPTNKEGPLYLWILHPAIRRHK